MGAQKERKTRSFSLTDEQFEKIMLLAGKHGFRDRNEYLLALYECDYTCSLRDALDPVTQKKVLRPQPVENMMADFERQYRSELEPHPKPKSPAGPMDAAALINLVDKVVPAKKMPAEADLNQKRASRAARK